MDNDTTRRLVAALDEAANRIESLEQARREPIAVIGVSCRFPGGADSPAAYWRLLRDGTDAIRDVPPDRWDVEAYFDPDPAAAGKMYTRSGGFLDRIDAFDAAFFEISPREAATLDPQHRLLLELTWHALEDANLPHERIAGTSTGVFVGITNNDYERLLRRLGDSRIDAYTSSGNTLNAAAGRLAYCLGLQGAAVSIDTACSSSLVAVHLACQALRDRECDLAVAAGVNLILSPEGTIALSRGRMVSPDGRCKTFDASADGYVRGEGCGVVILQRLSDVTRDGPAPRALIRGSAVNQDGASGGFTVPSGPAQQALVRRALAAARLQPADISYVEAHGTGTSLGDPIEVGALAAVFGRDRSMDAPLLIGSAKTNCGHLESAAGVAALIKVILSLEHGEIPPHLHFTTPSPHIAWDRIPLRVVTTPTPFRGTPRRAGVSAFGASGTNAHVILEEAPAIGERADDGAAIAGRQSAVTLLALSAKTTVALRDQVEQFCAFLGRTEAPLADIATSAALGRTHFAHRVAVVAETPAQAAAALRRVLDDRTSGPFGEAVADTATRSAVVRAARQAGETLLASHDPRAFDALCRIDDTHETYETPHDRSAAPRPSWLDVVRHDSDAWSRLLECLATLYTHGATIEWRALANPSSRAHVRLPAYPFQRRRCWFDAAAASDGTLVGERGHDRPLVGTRVDLPGSREIRFTTVLRADAPAWLQDHRVQGDVLFPAAGLIELMLEAAASAWHRDAWTLEAIVFERPLALATTRDTVVHVVLAPAAADTYTAHVFSRSSTRTADHGEDAWVCHASGRLASPAEEGMPSDAPEPVPTVPATAIAVDDYYAALAERGLAFGPAFQQLESLSRDADGTARGRVRAPRTAPSGTQVFHPAQLDAAFQTAGALAGHDNEAGAFVPFAIDRLRLYRRPSASPLAIRARAATVAGDTSQQTPRVDQWSAALTIHDADGIVAAIDGFWVRRAAAPAVDTTRSLDCLYVREWTAAPPLPRGAETLAAPGVVLDRLRHELAQPDVSGRLTRLHEAMAAIEAFAIGYVAHAARAFGLRLTRGERVDEAAVYASGGGLPIYRRLFARAMTMLEEVGVLARASGTRTWTVTAELAEPPLDETLARLLGEYPDADAELRMLDRCGRRIADVMRGRCEPLPLLYPEDDPLTAARLYRDSPGAALMNGLAGSAVRALIDHMPEGPSLRILEIGAGTGGTTASLLPLVAGRCLHYDFTDVSPRFVTARPLADDWPFVRYRTLDIERDPAAQGFARHRYDLVVAANVLHATRDLAESVRHAQSLLAPGGALLLLEGLRPLRFVDLTFGLTEGWWRFADTDVRAAHPLVSADTWCALLMRNGFGTACALSEAAGVLSHQGLLIARTTGARQRTSRAVIIGRGGEVASELARALAPHGIAARVVDADVPLSTLDGPADGTIETAAGDQASVPLRHVIHLAALDVADLTGADLTGADLTGADVTDDAGETEAIARPIERLSTSALDTVRALDAVRPAPHVWIVTRGAQPAGEAPTATGCVQAVSLGLARTLAVEYDDLRVTRVDLAAREAADDDGARARHEAEQLAREIVAEIVTAGHDDRLDSRRDEPRVVRHPRHEDEIALRGSERLVPRLRRRGPSPTTPAPPIVRSDRTYVVTGGLAGLGWLTAEWLIGRGARHLLLIGRREPSSSIAARVRAWQEAGLDVWTAACDVAVAGDLIAALAHARARAPLAGIFHSAGVLDDAAIVRQDWERFRRVLAPKAWGAWHLHHATLDDPLELFVLYSSTASLLGSPGQANHAAANAFLDALAWHRQGLGRPAVSINWGAWTGVGVAARHGVAERVKDTGIGVIEPEHGLRLLERVLTEAVAQVAVAPIDWPAFARHRKGRFMPALLDELIGELIGARPRDAHDVPVRARPAPADDLVARLRAAKAEGRSEPERLLQYVTRQLSRVLAIAEDEIDPTVSLHALGLDSLMALELRHRVTADLQVDIPLVTLLAGLCARELAAMLGPTGGPVDAAPEPREPARARTEERQRSPLSVNQQALWLYQQRVPHSAAYNTAFTARIRSPLDLEILQRSLRTLIARHAALRTTIRRIEDDLVQEVASDGALDFAHAVMPGCAEADWRQHAIDAYRQPFDLEQGPLFRARVFSRADDDHLLLLAFHHIICDAYAIWILVRELRELYAACVGGRAAALAAPGAQAPAFAQWQRDLLAGAEGDRLWAFWQRQLAGDLPVLELPTDRARPQVLSDRGASHVFAIDRALTDQLRALAKQEGVTLYVLLLAAFQVLLARYSGQEEIVVGSPVAGRSHPDFANLVGYVTNPVVLRQRVAPDQPFRELLAATRTTVLDALAHQDFPFPLLVERVNPQRDPGRSPIFQVLFVLQTASEEPWEGLRVEPFEIPQMEGQFELTLEVNQLAGALHCVAKYSTELFEAATIERLAGHFVQGLRSLVAGPDVRVAALEVVSAREAAQVWTTWNATAVAYADTAWVHEAIARQAAATPTAIAVVGPRAGDGEPAALTYAALDARANQLAHYLRARGVGPDVVVGVRLERSVELSVAVLGILKAGGAFLPLEVEAPAERVAAMTADAACTTVLTAAAWPALEAWPTTPPAVTVDGAHLAYVIYTSGSTGRPKGAMNTHAGLANRVRWMQAAYGLDATDAVLQKTPISFDVSVWELVWPLLTGARLVMAAPDAHRDSAALVATIAREGVTTLHFVPSMLQVFVEEPGVARCGTLRRVICSGEALSVAVEQRLGAVLPGVALHNLYGPTEAAIDVTAWTCGQERAARTVPIGRPIANTQTYILDGEGAPVPIGVVGELYLGGVGLARGYVARPDWTAARFVPHPRAAGARLYRTGDRCRYRADGVIEYVGRLDGQVKLRGMRIELGEVEAALARAAGVREAAATVIGGSTGQLVACVVGEVAPEAVRRWLRTQVPEALVPAVVVPVAALPRLTNGKIDRGAVGRLAQAALAQRLDAAAPDGRAPTTAIERQLAAIWADVLGGAPAARPAIGLDDNFFDLGGHSLLAATLLRRLHAAFDAPLTLTDIFQYPTVGALARRLAGDRQPSRVVSAPARVEEEAIAVIGMACRVPGADSADAFWANVRDGVESITTLSDDALAAAGVDAALRTHPRYVRARATLADITRFDAGFFGIPAREADLLDVQHRWFLECAWEAFEDAGHDPARATGAIGVYAGAGLNTYLLHNVIPNRDLVAAVGGFPLMLASDKDYLPTRVSYTFDLRGPSVNVQTACSTGLVAVHLACKALLAGECAMALAGGVSIHVPQAAGYLYEEGMILSPDGHCRPFDAQAAGTVAGSGVGIVLLKPLRAALADGDAIRGVILGSAINNDGRLKVGYTAPSVEGQRTVIAQALAAARVEPASIGYLETHGTGTALGDPIEFRALTDVFAAADGRTRTCALGAVKANIGHLDTAAGIAGLIKTLLVLQHRAIPPVLHFTRPGPEIDLDAGPFHVDSRLADWPSDGRPRRAGVSSFGIGGTNAHVVVEEAPPRDATPSARACHLLVVSARTDAALDRATDRLAAYLTIHPDLPLADIAYTLHVGRRHFAARRAIVCGDARQAAERLTSRDTRHVRTSTVASTSAPSVTFLFPGQGAQYPRMGAELYRTEPLFREDVDRCAELLRPHLGLDLRHALYERDDAAAIEDTAVAQPALFVTEYALARLWMRWGLEPRALIGHSLGEYVAATLAGVFSLDDALRLVAARGRLMHACPPGAMLAVALAPDVLRPLLESHVELAAINGPQACVASGETPAIEALARGLEARGIACQRLRTSHAFHSPMMASAVSAFADVVATTRRHPPRVPFVSNVTGEWIRAEEAIDPRYWARHLRETVRFADGMRTVVQTDPVTSRADGASVTAGDRVLIEIGPGSGLAAHALRQFDRDAPPLIASMRQPRDTRGDGEVLHAALGQAFLAGLSIDWPAVYTGERRRRVSLPTYPFEPERHWIDPPAATTAGDTVRARPRTSRPFYLPSWKRAPLPVPDDRVRSWLVFGRASALDEEIVRELRAKGHRVTLVERGARVRRVGADHIAIRPGQAEDYARLVEMLRADGGVPRHIVYAWRAGDALGEGASGAGTLSHRSLEGVAGDAALDEAFFGLLHLAQALETEDAEPIEMTVLSRGVHAIAGEPALDPLGALLLGPVRVIPREYPHLRCRSVDVASGRVTRLLLDELLAFGSAPSVAHRDQHRWLPAFEPVELTDAIPRLRRGGVYLITGGAGGIGLTLARHLVETYAAHVVVIGRSAPPANLDARLTYMRADVSDRARMAEVIADVRRTWGALHGVVHAAGVAAGGLIQRKTKASVLAILAPKVHGPLVLDEVLRDVPLDFCVLCSSVSAVIGEVGQVDYCAANAFVDAFAQMKHRAGHPWVAIDWDTWRDVGMAASAAVPEGLAAIRAERLREGIAPADGADAFARIVRSGLPQVLVSPRDLAADLDRTAQAFEVGAAAASLTPTTHARPALSRDYRAPADGTEQELTVIWEQLFGIQPIGVEDDFFELGGHSLLATQVLTRVRDAFGVRLPLASLFESTTIAALAARIDIGRLAEIDGATLERVLAEVHDGRGE